MKGQLSCCLSFTQLPSSGGWSRPTTQSHLHWKCPVNFSQNHAIFIETKLRLYLVFVHVGTKKLALGSSVASFSVKLQVSIETAIVCPTFGSIATSPQYVSIAMWFRFSNTLHYMHQIMQIFAQVTLHMLLLVYLEHSLGLWPCTSCSDVLLYQAY